MPPKHTKPETRHRLSGQEGSNLTRLAEAPGATQRVPSPPPPALGTNSRAPAALNIGQEVLRCPAFLTRTPTPTLALIRGSGSTETTVSPALPAPPHLVNAQDSLTPPWTLQAPPASSVSCQQQHRPSSDPSRQETDPRVPSWSQHPAVLRKPSLLPSPQHRQATAVPALGTGPRPPPLSRLQPRAP